MEVRAEYYVKGSNFESHLDRYMLIIKIEKLYYSLHDSGFIMRRKGPQNNELWNAPSAGNSIFSSSK